MTTTATGVLAVLVSVVVHFLALLLPLGSVALAIVALFGVPGLDRRFAIRGSFTFRIVHSNCYKLMMKERESTRERNNQLF